MQAPIVERALMDPTYAYQFLIIPESMDGVIPVIGGGALELIDRLETAPFEVQCHVLGNSLPNDASSLRVERRRVKQSPMFF